MSGETGYAEVVTRALEIGLALVDAALQRGEPGARVGEAVARCRDPRALRVHGRLQPVRGGLLAAEVLRGGGSGEAGHAGDDGERCDRAADGTRHE